MPKYIKGKRKYDLLARFGKEEFGASKEYNCGKHLYAWYQFEKSLAPLVTASGIEKNTLPDLSGKGRFLQPDPDESNDANWRTDHPDPQNIKYENDFHTAPLGFPRKSSDFSKDVLSHPVDAVPGSDFFFNLGGQDIPFSGAAWVKLSVEHFSLNEHGVIFGKFGGAIGGHSGSDVWRFSIDQGKPQVTLFGANNGSIRIQRQATQPDAGGTLKANKWYHIAFTYSGSETVAGIKIYVNGSQITSNLTDSSVGSYSGLVDDTSTMFSVAGIDPEHNDYDLKARLLEAAVWNKELSADEIGTLYSYPLVTSHWRSGYLTNPPRTILHDDDSKPGRYPVNARTGDTELLRKKLKPYNDQDTVEFLSPFAIAEINLIGSPELILGAAIGLSSSDGNYKKAFQFLPGDSVGAGFLHNTADYSPALSANDIAVRINTKDPAQFFSKNFYAFSLVKKINELKGELNLTARKVKNSIILERHEPALVRDTGKVSIVKIHSMQEGVISVKHFDSRQPHLVGETRSSLGIAPKSRHSQNNLLIPTPNLLPDITSFRKAVPGVSDYGVILPGEVQKIAPFDESRVDQDAYTNFFLSGTSHKILPGFEGPTRSKTNITFELKSSNNDGYGTLMFFSTGSKGLIHPTIANTSGSGMSYWNSKDNRWEMLEPPVFDVFSHARADRHQSTKGFALHDITLDGFTFSGVTNPETIKRRIQLNRMTLEPISSFGFPFASQYNATSSQCYKMSDHISSPFLLEKAKVEIEGRLGIRGTITANSAFAGRAFFMLAQKSNPDDPHTEDRFTMFQQVRNSSNEVNMKQNPILTKGNRELVAYSKILTLPNDHKIFTHANQEDIDELESNFAKVIRFSSANKTSRGISVTSSFDCFPRLGLSNDVLSYGRIRRTSANNSFESPFGDNSLLTVEANRFGGANLKGDASGRQLSVALDHADISTEFTGTSNSATNMPEIPIRTENSKISPYVLLPTDNLIFGWQTHPAAHTNESVSGEDVVDMISKMKITLYGSLVRDSKEFHDSLSQPLTSYSIHEAIFGSTDVDEFDVEPLDMLSGSIFDSLMLGKMIGKDKDGNIITGVRGRRGSIVRGDAGPTGSMSRNIHIADQSAKFSDTLQPPAWFFMQAIMGSAKVTGSNSTASGFRPSFITGSRTLGGDSFRRNFLELSPKPQLKVSTNLGFGQVVKNKSRLLLGSLGVCNIKEFNIQKTPQVNLSPFSPPGGGILFNSPAFSLAIDMGPPHVEETQLMIFSGSINEALGTNSKFNLELSKEPALAPPSLRTQTSDSAKALQSLLYAMPKINIFGNPNLGGGNGYCGGYQFPVKPLLKLGGGGGVVPDLRGFKYGIMNTDATPPRYTFRRNKYGQFRDMMETPVEAACQNGKYKLAFEQGEIQPETLESPVKIVFVSRGGDSNIDPLDTNSQNLSHFATSSVPYIDGKSLDRNVLVDPPPDMTDVTTLEEKVDQILDGDS